MPTPVLSLPTPNFGPPPTASLFFLASPHQRLAALNPLQSTRSVSYGWPGRPECQPRSWLSLRAVYFASSSTVIEQKLGRPGRQDWLTLFSKQKTRAGDVRACREANNGQDKANLLPSRVKRDTHTRTRTGRAPRSVAATCATKQRVNARNRPLSVLPSYLTCKSSSGCHTRRIQLLLSQTRNAPRPLAGYTRPQLS